MNRILLLAAWVSPAVALAAPPAPPAAASTPAALAAPVNPLLLHQRFQEQAVEDWRAANERVAARGGWRVYTREAQEALRRERAERKP